MGEARRRMLEIAQLKENAKKRICPLLSSGWVQVLQQTGKPVIIGQHAVQDQPMAQGIAQVACVNGADCAWWHEDAGQCAIFSILGVLIEINSDEEDEDNGGEAKELPLDPGGQSAGREAGEGG
jgi:hypothetical protein